MLNPTVSFVTNNMKKRNLGKGRNYIDALKIESVSSSPSVSNMSDSCIPPLSKFKTTPLKMYTFKPSATLKADNSLI